MKSQYPSLPSSYLYTEPLNYLQNFCGIRQATEEFVQFLKSDAAKIIEDEPADSAQLADTEQDNSLGSFFYTKSFNPPNED